MKDKTLTKTQFLILSYTWGIILTAAGYIAAGVLLLTGHKMKKYGWCRYFEAGKAWGGCEFGLFFIRDKTSGDYICMHEFGHAIQNALYGPLTPFIVCLPSSSRYWLRKLSEKLGRRPKTGYYDVWFEKQASELGAKYMKKIRQDAAQKERQPEARS